MIFLCSIGKKGVSVFVASLIRLRHLVRFMLKVKQLVLLDGNTLDDVEMIPTDTGYLVNIEVSGKKCLREIPRERVGYIDYEDSKTIDLLKGIALVPIVEDMEEVDAIYEEYGDLSSGSLEDCRSANCCKGFIPTIVILLTPESLAYNVLVLLNFSV